MKLDIRVDSDSADEVVLAVDGSVDLANRDALREAATREYRPEVASWAMDLSGVTFMDSTGLGALIEIAGDADDAGCRFSVRNPSQPVSRLLDLTGLHGRLVGGA